MTWLPPADEVLRVTLLGTGIPNAQINAFGTSTLIEAGAERILIDLKPGVSELPLRKSVSYSEMLGETRLGLSSDTVLI